MIVLHQIDPIAFGVGPLQVHWYGIMYLLGFATAWWLGRRRIRAGRLPGVDEQGFGDLLFYGPAGSQSVALFVGNGQMIEGTEPSVSVTQVRTNGMDPYLSRIIEWQ